MGALSSLRSLFFAGSPSVSSHFTLARVGGAIGGFGRVDGRRQVAGELHATRHEPVADVEHLTGVADDDRHRRAFYMHTTDALDEMHRVDPAIGGEDDIGDGDIGDWYPAGDYVCLFDGNGEIAFDYAAKAVSQSRRFQYQIEEDIVNNFNKFIL